MGTKLCEICGKRSARYVCQECSRSTCERCLEPHTWLCSECYKRVEPEVPRTESEGISPFQPLFVKVFFVGFFLVSMGIVILMIAALVHGVPGSVGLILFIGPIPIVLGAGEYSFLAVLLAAILTVLSIVAFVLLRSKKWTESPL